MESKRKQFKPPFLVESTLNGLVVLATGPGCDAESFSGISIQLGESGDGTLWDFDDCWNKSLFVPFEGTVTITSSY
jgi:hypothetical protein